MEQDTKRVKQACDACKLRKVRCNGKQRCQQCSHTGLKCIYSAAKSRQRKQIKRGGIISQYRETTTSPSSTIAPPLQPAPPKSAIPLEESCCPLFSSPPPSHGEAFFLDLIPEYNEAVFPVNPIITEQEVRESIAKLRTDKEHRAFCYAYAAVTVNLARARPPDVSDVWNQIADLTTKAIQIRGVFMPDEQITVRKIMISMFLHNCLMNLRKSEMAFYYLRDALSMIQILRVDDSEAMAKFDVPERARRQRLYWEAFVHERFLAVLDYRPAILPPLQDLPEFDPTLPSNIREGFLQITKLFCLVDGEFLQNWLGSQGAAKVTPTWIEKKHKQLDDDITSSTPGTAMLSQMQQADLIITRQWLRTLVWQMAMSKCLLSSSSSKECMSLLFPVRLSHQLRHLITSISRQDIEIHGSGILQKLFEITDTIANVIIHIPAPTLEETSNRLEDFLFLINFLFFCPRFDPVRREILQKKVEHLQTLFPYTSSTRVPENDMEIPAAATQQVSSPQDPWLYSAQWMMSPRLNTVSSTFNSPASEDFGGDNDEAYLAESYERWHDMTRRLSVVRYD